MHCPRFRLSVRAMLALVAACAIIMLIYNEIRGGPPPRFIIRALPSRITQLRPGMTPAQASSVMGLDRPWYRGGVRGFSGRRPPGSISTTYSVGRSNSGVSEDYTIGRVRLGARVAESGPDASSYHVIGANVHLEFLGNHAPGTLPGPNGADRLVSAWFTDIEGRRTEMPGSR